MLTADAIKRLVKADLTENRIVIDPWHDDQLNPNSYDLRLSRKMRWYPGGEILDVRKDPSCMAKIKIPKEGFVLEPGELYLGCSVEYTESHNLIPMINGRSSLARLGVSVHQTGGFGDIGYCGNWTLEITVIRPVRIYADMKFAQICWFFPKGAVNRIYDGKYQNSRSEDPVGSRISNEFLNDPRTGANLRRGPDPKEDK